MQQIRFHWDMDYTVLTHHSHQINLVLVRLHICNIHYNCQADSALLNEPVSA